MTDTIPKRVFPPAVQLHSGPLVLPPLILGAGVYGTDYASADQLQSQVPVNAIRRAFQYGITTLDTSPYYTTSEAVLGRAFEALKDEFPRESYQIITKVGRYGRTKEEGFDYSADRVRKSIANSLKLMGTTYLDGVYAHDVEFVAEQVGDAGKAAITVGPDGDLSAANLAKWGLAPGEEGTIRGPGDEKVLEAIKTLFELKKAGVIRAVGFSGFPLPTMLRLARLIKVHLEPLDIIQSYSHFTLQNTTLSAFAPLFREAGVKQIITASPLSMGLLRSQGPQPWHPASAETKVAAEKAVALCASKGTTLEHVSLGFGFASASLSGAEEEDTPTVVGLSTVAEVEETMAVYGEIYGAGEKRTGRKPGEGLSERCKLQLELERGVVELFRESGTYNLGWDSGV